MTSCFPWRHGPASCGYADAGGPEELGSFKRTSGRVNAVGPEAAATATGPYRTISIPGWRFVVTARMIRVSSTDPSASRELTTRRFPLPQTGGVRLLDLQLRMGLVVVLVLLVLAVCKPAAAVATGPLLLPAAVIADRSAVRCLRILPG